MQRHGTKQYQSRPRKHVEKWNGALKAAEPSGPQKRGRLEENKIPMARRTHENVRHLAHGSLDGRAEVMRQACDAAVREAGRIADDAQELLMLDLPRLLLPASKRKKGMPTAQETKLSKTV